LSENLQQFNFGELPHHPLEMDMPMILNDPHKEKSSGFKSIESGGHATGLPLTSHRPENLQFKYLQMMRLKCVGPPSCMKLSSQRMISGTSAKKSGMLFSKEAL
jgi:hypothetical protein